MAERRRRGRDRGGEHQEEVDAGLRSELRRSRHSRADHLVLERRRKGAQSPAAFRLRLRSTPIIACSPSPCLRNFAGPQSGTAPTWQIHRLRDHHSPKLGVWRARHIPLFRYGLEIPRTSEGPGCPGPSSFRLRRGFLPPAPSVDQGVLAVPPELRVPPPETALQSSVVGSQGSVVGSGAMSGLAMIAAASSGVSA